ncbi:energy-coupling factor transporter transmembrane protein EcfT [Candidatus Bathyarchaeota archaeon]|nr:energy-coupling factor transporter transmembrane protein EcfT [Candidatus Bathyarchaeota archaeon]
MLEGFRFRRKESIIHRLDPRVKGFYSLVMMMAAILYSEFHVMAFLALIQIPLVFLARVQKEWLRSLKGSAFFASFIFIINLLTGYLYSGLVLTSETIFYSLSMTLRFIILMESFSLFFLTTIPDDLSLALEKMGIPHDFCFAFTSAIRFVPDLALEIQSIMDAQKSRGLELEKGSFMERIRNYIPILIPMLIRSFQRSLELAEAMESRAYGALKKRTSLYELKMVRSDYMATALIIIFLFTMLYVKFFIKLP